MLNDMSAIKIKAGILGATGYGAGELLRLLCQHPNVEIASLVSSSSPGTPITQAHPHLAGLCSALSCDADLPSTVFESAEHGVIFCALPHGTSGAQALSLLRDARFSKVKIIDLSGDLRLHELELAKKWYPETEFVVSERNQITYGLPEMNREQIAQSRLVSNPGCLASAAILALAPLRDRLQGDVIIDAKTGTSGAGRAPQPAFHHPAMHASCNAYKVLEHRHEAEIREVLGDPFEQRFSTSFVPHVIPTSRGIYVTCYVTLADNDSAEKLIAEYRAFYARSSAIVIEDGVPELRSAIGGNFCHIGIRARKSRVVIMAALDNLVRGMSGVAIQNMNIMFGLPELSGLSAPGLGII